MENGMGVVEEIHVGEVKAGDDGMAELKVEEMVDAIGFHRRKESEGDEVFEEAIEPSLSDGFDNTDDLKPDSDAAAASKIDIGDGDSGFYAAEGNSSVVDGWETIVDALAKSDEGRKGVGESTGKSEISLAADNDEGSVAVSCSNDSLEGLPVVDERSLNQEDGLASISSDVAVEKSSSEGLEVEPSTVEETKTVVTDEDVVEKLVVVENSENRDAEDIGKDDAGAHPDKDVDNVAANGVVNHVNETKREVGDASVVVSYEDQMEKLEESIEAVAGNQNGHVSTEVEDASASSNSKNWETNGVSADNPSGYIDSEIQIASRVSEGQEHHDEDSEVKESPPGTSAPVDSPAAMISEIELSIPAKSSVNKDVKSDKVAPEIDNATDRSLSSDATVGRNLSLPEGHAIKERKTEEKQNSRATSKTTVKAAQSSVSSSGKSANPTGPPARPAGLGRAAPLLEPAPRAVHQPRANGQVSQVQSSVVEDTTNGEVEEGDDVREKLQMIRVKFLRLAHRLGQTPHNVVVAQVLYRLGLAEQLRARNGGRVGAFSFDRASAMAEQLEATGREPLDFSCTIMVLGKTGVGKSATINSIFDEVKFNTDAFQMGTKKVQDVVGTVQGIKVRVIDTPGLLPSCVDQRQNERILHSVKRFIKKSPPDIVLYLDRLDMPGRDFGDMPLLRTITEIFGPSIWFNAIVVLTHAASAPPEGPNGTASTYDMFVTQRSHAVQQAIRQAAGDMRLMNPVSLVENHSACRTNRAGQRVLPNGQVWKPHLLLLSFASKILAEANTLLKLQDTPPGKPFTTRSRAPSLPLLLSSLLQSRPQLKLPDEQYADDDAMDDDLDESSDSDDDSEYDELPPFRPLAKDQLAKLSKAQKKAYYDELEYREKLFMKKQLKEEKRRRKMMKKMEAAAKDIPGEYGENVGSESDGAASLPVPMPDLPLPASFDSDNPTHRYRCLDTSNQWLVRPNLDTHGWDHDVGYEGVNVERMFVLQDKIPVSFSGLISKDKKEANLQMELASSMKHGEGKATTMGFDMQSVGKDMAYTLRSETRFSNYRHNKATAGLSATVLGDALSAGVKLEDKIIVNKQFRMVMSGGAMAGRGDVAYGGSLEATFRDKDYPVGRFLSTLGLSVMDWHGELALGGNIQTQIPVGRLTTLVARANLNNRGSGQVSLRWNSSEQLQLALIGLIPLLRKLIGQYQEHPFGH